MESLRVAVDKRKVSGMGAGKTGGIILSLVGAGFLAGGDIRLEDGNVTAGILWAALSVIAYGTYIVGVRKTAVQNMPTLPLTVYVMGFGAICFTLIGMLSGGVRWVPLSDGFLWANILGIAAGIILIIIAVTAVVLSEGRHGKKE